MTLHVGIVLLSLLQAPRDREPLAVVTTLGVLADLVQQVGGAEVTVEALATPDQDPHSVQPRPTLMKKARDAELFIEIGLQLELWASKVVEGSGNPRIQAGQPGRLVATFGVTTLERPELLSRDLGDVHPYGNPHVWLDPIQAITMAGNIEQALARLRPESAATFAARRQTFQTSILERLFGPELLGQVGEEKVMRLTQQGKLEAYLEHKQLAARVGGWMASCRPLRGKAFISYHRTFSYLAQRFGFEVPATLEEKPGIPPSARHRDAILARIREGGIQAIVQAPYYSRSAADHVAAETEIEVLILPIDLNPEAGIRTYFDLIDVLVQRLVAAASRP